MKQKLERYGRSSGDFRIANQSISAKSNLVESDDHIEHFEPDKKRRLLSRIQALLYCPTTEIWCASSRLFSRQQWGNQSFTLIQFMWRRKSSGFHGPRQTKLQCYLRTKKEAILSPCKYMHWYPNTTQPKAPSFQASHSLLQYLLNVNTFERACCNLYTVLYRLQQPC